MLVGDHDLLVVGSCFLVEESCLLRTYYFVYLNVSQVMKRGRFLHQSSLRFSVLFAKFYLIFDWDLSTFVNEMKW